jgi:hypothetical protein
MTPVPVSCLPNQAMFPARESVLELDGHPHDCARQDATVCFPPLFFYGLSPAICSNARNLLHMTIERRGTCSPDTAASWTHFKRSDESQLMSVMTAGVCT